MIYYRFGANLQYSDIITTISSTANNNHFKSHELAEGAGVPTCKAFDLWDLLPQTIHYICNKAYVAWANLS